MTDAGALAIVGVITTAVSSAWGAWIHYQVNKNACGGARCVDTMTKALGIKHEHYNFPGGYDYTAPGEEKESRHDL